MPDQTIYFKRTPEDNPGGVSVCDFCGEQDPVTAYPASSFVISVVTSEGSYSQDYNDDGWAACAWCALLIEQHDVPRLVERYFVVHPMTDGLSVAARAFLRGLVSTQFDLFFEHRDGPSVAYQAVQR